jgi:hypothetical protein
MKQDSSSARRRVRTLTTFALGLTLVLGAATLTRAAQPTADSGETVEEKLVCKSVKPLGTRMAKRICATPEQWAAAEGRSTDRAEEGMRQMRRQGSLVVAPPSSAPQP